MEFLHKGLVLRSDKQNSAQGSVFYVKKEDERENIEYVLKVVSESFEKILMSVILFACVYNVIKKKVMH